MMARIFVIAAALLALASAAEAKSKKRMGPHQALDKELKSRRQDCEPEIDSSLSPHERENLILKCLSEECYQTIYAQDPLEEGEVDSARGRDYRSCCRSELKTERQQSKAQLLKAATVAEEEAEGGEVEEGEEGEDDGEAVQVPLESAAGADAADEEAEAASAPNTAER